MSLSSAAGSEDDRLLTCGDATIIRSDLSILRGPLFLNDRLIHFYFSHLATTICDDRILLVAPSIAFLISNFPDPSLLGDIVAPLKLGEKEIVLFPVNDNPDVALAEGGSHWSLLVFHLSSRVFVHHDSHEGMNRVHAFKLYKAVKGFISENELRYMEGPTPQQMNGYDCGVFVLAIARSICEWYYKNENKKGLKEDKEKWFGSLLEEVNGNKVREFRVELLDLILEMMEKNNSRISKSLN